MQVNKGLMVAHGGEECPYFEAVFGEETSKLIESHIVAMQCC